MLDRCGFSDRPDPSGQSGTPIRHRVPAPAPALRAFLIGATVAGLATAGFAAGSAHAATTDMYPDWGFNGSPGLAWKNYIDWSHTGNSNNFGDTIVIPYYTATGLTGTTRDSFEFWGGAGIGYANTPDGSANSGWGVAQPEIGAEWYYNVINSDRPFRAPDFRQLTVGPWFQITAPDGNTQSHGYGAGDDQWSYSGALVGSYRSGRFTTTLQPIMLSYSDTNLNTQQFSTPSGTNTSTKLRSGLSGSFGVWNVGYDVTEDLTLAVLQGWNVYSFSGTKGELRTEEGTIGPMFSWRGLSRWGITVNGGVQVDYYHTPGLPEGIYVSSYIQKHF